MLKKMFVPLLLMTGLVSAQESSFTVGKWQLRVGSDITVSYAGRTLLSGIGLAAYEPGWKKTRFSFSDAAMTREGDVFTWRKQDQAAEASVALAFSGQELNITLNALVQPDGPFEFGLTIPPESMKTDDGAIFCCGDGRSVTISDEESFASLSYSSLAFELPEMRFTFKRAESPHAFTFQDRRLTPQKNLRYIMSTAVSAEAKAISSSVLLAVEEFAEETIARRRLALRTPVRRITQLTLANAGFEDGQDSWAFGKTASLDRDVVHAGAQAACLTVADPMTETVYITRQVPIIGGVAYEASCFVKTDNVQAKPGKMSSVGAGLIVEWSDKNGKWLAGGEYACDLYGSSDWQLKQCKSLRAPEDAGFASVFLALRGAGRAWFDDFSMRQVEISVDKLSPEPGAVLTTNTPFFSWAPLLGVASYVLELSPDSTFPAAATRRYELGIESSWQLREPLPPGEWYWQVTSIGSPDVQPWAFAHAVPVDRDCLPPIITGRAWRVTAPDSSVDLVISEESTQAPTLTAAIGDGQAVSIGAPRALGENRFAYPLTMPAGWPRGLNTVQVRATDASGNRADKVLWLLQAPKPADAVVIDADGNYSQAGQKIFPLGIYEVRPDDMPLINSVGFEVVHTYRWEGDQNDVACREYLDACAANGLRAFIGFDRGVGSGKGMVQGNFEHLAHRVGALADHPGLFCWYLYDEPEIVKQYVSPELLTSLAQLVRELDPFHPVVMTTWGNGMNRYRQTWDTHWTQSYSTPAEIVNTIASHRKLLLNDSPITLLIHCYDRTQSALLREKKPVAPEKFSPDGDWMRAAAFVGVVKGVNGLWWWWYAAHQQQFYTVATVPHAWESLCATVRDIRALRPLILAAGTVQSGTVEVKKDVRIEWWAKSVAGKQSVIAVNTSEEELEAVIPIPGRDPAPMSFTRYEVKILER